MKARLEHKRFALRASTRREALAWGRSIGLLVVIFGTLAALVVAGLSTI